ncbi:MAG: hypothetical protein ACXWYE_09005 [Actinomycetota bacterium]
MSHNGQHTSAGDDERTRRLRTIALIVVVGIAALAGGLFLGSRSGDDPAISTTSPWTSSPTASTQPTLSEAPSETPGGSSTLEPTPAALDEGRHFVLADEVVASGGGHALVLDLGSFLTGDEANEAAAEAGMETPVPDGYYIVNDNPRLRTVPISPDASVRYIPADPCCDLVLGDLDAWMDAVNGEVMRDMVGEISTTWWWVTVRHGSIVAIEQQYFP